MISIDFYELRARLAPTLLVLAPWILVIVVLGQTFAPTIITTSAAVLIFVALLYAFSFLVRGLGRRVENGLWDSWGGPLSALVLTEADSTFSKETKVQICRSVATTLGIKGASELGWGNKVSQSTRSISTR